MKPSRSRSRPMLGRSGIMCATTCASAVCLGAPAACLVAGVLGKVEALTYSPHCVSTASGYGMPRNSRKSEIQGLILVG
jgi:hypothetical protein